MRAPAPVHLCPQQVEHLDEAIEAFAWGWSPGACRWRGRLGLEPADLERWQTLSPGERKRWQIGAALASEPPVLLLDEPTNHLDTDGRDLLVAALGRYRGVGAVVSHDRGFLDALTNATVLVEGGARAIGLPPTEALAQRALERQAALDALTAAQQEARDARRTLADARRSHHAAVHATSTARRVKGPRDHDGRSMAAKARAACGERARARAVGIARADTARAEAAVGALERPTTLGRSVFVAYEPAPKQIVLALLRREIRIGERVLLRDVELVVERGRHVHLAGPNGAGKTTLLAALLGASALPADRVLYVPQEITESEAATWRDRLDALDRDARGRVLQVVAALGVDPAALLATQRPSPGEARKLAIAFGLGGHAWAVVLDEPTNHLDLPSIERLEAALTAFPGALILVTHDAQLAAACCTERWRLADGRVVREAIGAIAPGVSRPRPPPGAPGSGRAASR